MLGVSLSTTALTAKNSQIKRFGIVYRMFNKWSKVLSPNLILSPCDNVLIEKNSKTWIVKGNGERSLVLLFEYMNAKKKHINKFIEFYSEKKFDVLTVSLKPSQLFWPVTGSQVVAKEVADFLLYNATYQPILYHGFSVGGYLWGEVLRIFVNDQEKYHTVIPHIRGQILDSGVDVAEIPTGFSSAVFPEKPFLRNVMESTIRFEMSLLYNKSTRYYIESRKAFTSGILKVPTLLMYSADSDPLSTPAINARAHQDFTNQGIECYIKEFSGAKHVMNYQKYPAEYLKEVDIFLNKIALAPSIKAKL